MYLIDPLSCGFAKVAVFNIDEAGPSEKQRTKIK